MALLLAFLLTFSIPGEAIDEIAWVESRHNPRAVSPAGAVGVMQVMPHTARNPGFDIEPLHNPWDPRESREFGRRYFRALIIHFGSVEDALRAYNWGAANVERWIKMGRPAYFVPDETKQYVERLETPVLRALKNSWRRRSLNAEMWTAVHSATRDKTKTGLRQYSYLYDPLRSRHVWSLFQSISDEGPLTSSEKHLFKNGISLTMPHGRGINLSISKDRVMNAPLPSANRASKGLSPFQLGKREGREAMQEGDFDRNISVDDDMVRGIVENAGLQPNRDNLMKFVEGWMASSQGSQQEGGERVLQDAETVPDPSAQSVFV